MNRHAFTTIELLVVLAIILILLALMGILLPLDLLFNLAFGWIIYLYRTLPRVRIDGSGVLTAVVCLGALAIGLQWFLRWLAGQTPRNAASADEVPSAWPARRTGVLLSLIVLMFVAGIAAAGMGHQIVWLLTSPEPIFDSSVRRAVGRVQTQNCLKQMALAMHNYQSIEGTLPPAAIYDQHGQPLLSWRVLILPYIEEEMLYKEFHLDEPWDSPHNLRLLPRMPRIYASHSGARSVKSFFTAYQVFVGKGAAFEGKRGLRLPEDFPDGTANTLLIVEAAEQVPWTKPADLPFDRQRLLPALGWSSRQDCQVVMVDGSVRSLSRSLTESTLRAAITRNGGETLGPDW